jgi:hypothetical protein
MGHRTGEDSMMDLNHSAATIQARTPLHCLPLMQSLHQSVSELLALTCCSPSLAASQPLRHPPRVYGLDMSVIGQRTLHHATRGSLVMPPRG